MSVAVVERIRDLFKLAENNTSEAEASAALAAAQRLMAKHRIERAEIEALGREPEEVVAREDVGDELRKRIPRWEGALFATLCVVNDCASMQRGQLMGKKRLNAVLQAVGRASDVQAVRYMHAFITRQIVEMAQQIAKSLRDGGHEAPRGWAVFHEEFRTGAAIRVAHRLRAAAAQSKAEARAHASGAALVLVDRALERAQDEVKRLTSNVIKNDLEDRRRDPLARSMGLTAGGGIDIDRGRPALEAPKPQLPR